MRKYVGSQVEAKNRLKIDKVIDAYKSVTFVFKKETDLFLAWNQPGSDKYDSRLKQSEFVSKAKLEVKLMTDRQNAKVKEYYVLILTEDVINKAREGGKQLSESHMQHI